MKKRGQAAMEFLMTYGWAILAAIIVIAVLAIYFRPSQLTSGTSVVTAPFYAVGSVVDPTQVQLEIRNNGGESLTLQRVDIKVNNPSGASCNNMTTQISPFSAGQDTIILFDTCDDGVGGMDSGELFNADVTIVYQRPSGNLNLTATGTIAGTVA